MWNQTKKITETAQTAKFTDFPLILWKWSIMDQNYTNANAFFSVANSYFLWLQWQDTIFVEMLEDDDQNPTNLLPFLQRGCGWRGQGWRGQIEGGWSLCFYSSFSALYLDLRIKTRWSFCLFSFSFFPTILGAGGGRAGQGWGMLVSLWAWVP